MYVELHTASAFSFLAGASTPEALVDRAAALGYPALALLDRDGLYGAPRFHMAAKAAGIKAIVGAELTIDRGRRPGTGGQEQGNGAASGLWPPASEAASGLWRLPVLVSSQQGYRNLCRLVTRMKLGAPKGEGALALDDLDGHTAGLIALVGRTALAARRFGVGGLVDRVVGLFGRANVCVELQRHLLRDEESDNQALAELASAFHVPVVATGGVRFAAPDVRPLYDVLTCIRHKTTIARAGRRLSVNAERYLKPPDEMARLFEDLPRAVAASRELADRLAFTMADLGYRFPDYPVPEGETQASFLRKIAEVGARERYRPYHERARRQIARELDLIEKLELAGYFLIVWDVVNFCRQQGILAQGRGSAANSAVCYSLGITAVDPVGMDLLFERFLSEERGEWPDIDLDLPSGDRRERVIQYVYERYGKHGAAMTANVITYRGRSAAREVGKVLGFEPDEIDRLAKTMTHFEFEEDARSGGVQGGAAVRELTRGAARGAGAPASDAPGGVHPSASSGCPEPVEGQGSPPMREDSLDRNLREAGLDPARRDVRLFADLWRRIQDLPRHLGQHSGGMVICQGRLDDVVPLENAAMPGRVVVQWDKEDCADMGIVKVDLLGLGMMAVLQDALEVINSAGTRNEERGTRDERGAERGEGVPASDALGGVQGSPPVREMMAVLQDALEVIDAEARGPRPGAKGEDSGVKGFGPRSPASGPRSPASGPRPPVPGPRPPASGPRPPASGQISVVDLAHLPQDDPEVYRMLQEADTIGVFQVESRAQMATLPRLKPACFYDLVVEVAIIRPGPIVGQMVHPYLRRRQGLEPVVYPHPSLAPILERTLGVPLFQEQLLRMAMVAAGFTGGEAEELRRAFGFKRSVARMKTIEEKLYAGMARQGIAGEAAASIVRSISSFALYGFPESHAASFALLVYASAYLKAHYPAAFYAAMLNNQPMGFYHPATLVKDAQRRGVRFAPIDVQRSNWLCAVEPDGRIRLGLRYVAGLREDVGRAIEAGGRKPEAGGRGPEVGMKERGTRNEERRRGHEHGTATERTRNGHVHESTQSAIDNRQSPIDHARFSSIDDLIAKTGLRRDELATLAEIGALGSFGHDRRGALWQIERAVRPVGELFQETEKERGTRDEERDWATGAGRWGLGESEQERGTSDEARDRARGDGRWAMENLDRRSAGLQSGLIDNRQSSIVNPEPESRAPSPEPRLGASPLRPMTPLERVAADYKGTGLTIGPHPMAFRRRELALRGVLRAIDLPRGRHGRRVRVAGAVITRQRPGTAKGFVFLTLEDETGIANIIVQPDLFAGEKLTIVSESYVVVEGTLQIQDGVTSVKAERVLPLGGYGPAVESHDFY